MFRNTIFIVLLYFFPVSMVSASLLNLSFDPSNSVQQLGDSFAVDVNINNVQSSGVGAIGAFDVDIWFSQTNSLFGYDVLAFTGLWFGEQMGMFNLDPFLADAFGDWSLSRDSATNSQVLNVSVLSLLPTSELVALQGDSFTVATLFFDALNVGPDVLSFDTVILSDGDGFSASAITQSGFVKVPEPAILFLISTGLVIIGLFRWK